MVGQGRAKKGTSSRQLRFLEAELVGWRAEVYLAGRAERFAAPGENFGDLAHSTRPAPYTWRRPYAFPSITPHGAQS